MMMGCHGMGWCAKFVMLGDQMAHRWIFFAILITNVESLKVKDCPCRVTFAFAFWPYISLVNQVVCDSVLIHSHNKKEARAAISLTQSNISPISACMIPIANSTTSR